MCAPDYFGVDYVINAWMKDQVGKSDRALAIRQWQGLRDLLASYTDMAFEPPQPKVPDLVFTANAGLVLGDKVIVSRFRDVERQAEEPYLRNWFAANHFTITDWPQNIPFEGAGDCLLDRGQELIWAGHGFRSDAASPPVIEKIMKRRTVGLKLVDPRFYHLDTCFCPLEGGWLLYYPAAFDKDTQEKIAAEVSESKRIAVTDDDALRFACNAVELDRHIFMNDASDALQGRLRRAGFTPLLTPLSEFLKAGGGAKCLTLKLVEA
jgi:N-dimethylarginine dimethylaminohydrolase